MEQIKVLVVDDSSLMRKLIKKMVESDPKLQVVDTAMNGLFALKKIEKYDIDVILLDIEMPEMDGIEFLIKCRELGIDIPIVVLSSLGKNRPEVTLKCISLGAKDFIIKPSGTISLDIDLVQDEVVSKIKYFFAESPRTRVKKEELKESIDKISQEKAVEADKIPLKGAEVITAGIEDKLRVLRHFEAVAIGISTGGPYALRKIIPTFPADFPLPILVVQHMPPGFTLEFAKGLDEISPMTVIEAKDQAKIEKGTVYIAQGDKHLTVKSVNGENVLELNSFPQVNGHRPSVEVLFDSINEVYKNRTLAVIMTGMGKDGARAIKRLKLNGAVTLAQSERTCVVYGMPKVAVEEGGIDEVVDLDDIPNRIMELTNKF